MILCVFGSRKGISYQDVSDGITEALFEWDSYIAAIERIIHGDASGADRLSKVWGDNHDIEVVPYPAAWKDLDARPCKIKQGAYGPYNALAGFNRNDVMADIGTHFVGIRRQGKSPGTDDMARRIESREKSLYLHTVTCQYDTNGDGNCGRRACPVCV